MTCMVPRSNLAHVTRFQKRVLASLSALLIFSGLGFSGLGFSASSASAADGAPAANEAAQGPVVVIGVGGLLWSDISQAQTPALFDLVGASDLSSLSVRTQGEITCPADGWLTLATGRRTLADERGTDPVCAQTRALDLTGTRPAVDLEQLTQVNHEYGWRPYLGQFGTDIKIAGLDATAVGPGAALSLVDGSGRTPTYFADLPAFLDSIAARDGAQVGDLLVVDAGNVSEPGFVAPSGATAQPSAADRAEEDGRQTPSKINAPSRAEQLASIDDQIAQLLRMLDEQPGPDARVLLFGPGGTSPTAHLTVLAQRDTETGTHWLRAESTRREGVLHLTDLNPTLRAQLGVDAALDAVGSPAHASGERGDTAGAVAELSTDDAASHVIRDSLAPLTVTVGALNLLGLGAALVLGRGALRSRGAPRSRFSDGLWRFFAALAVAPLATFVGSGLPWTHLPGVGLGAGLVICIIAAWAVLSAVVLLGRWRRHLLGPVAAAGLLTAVVLLIDSATGSALQWVSPLGDTPLVAGRFYGISNPPFTLAYTGALVGLAIVSVPLVRRFSPRVAAIAMVAFGSVFTVLVASPAAGADGGGPIASARGFIVLVQLVSQVKITRSGIGFMVFGGIFVFAVSALIDFAQPPEQRAHLGRFIARVGQGELVPMLWRKIEASFTIVSENLIMTLIALLITGLLATMVAFPAHWKIGALDELYAAFPLLRAGVISALIGISIAVFTNDSGVALAFITLMILAPMLAAVTIRHWFGAQHQGGAGGDLSAVDAPKPHGGG